MHAAINMVRRQASQPSHCIVEGERCKVTLNIDHVSGIGAGGLAQQATQALGFAQPRQVGTQHCTSGTQGQRVMVEAGL